MRATRDDILEHFTIEDGRIVSPGRFEGQRIYVPYFWDAVQDGWQDDEEYEGDIQTAVFFITPEDRQQFPELESKLEVRVRQIDDGFIVEVER